LTQKTPADGDRAAVRKALHRMVAKIKYIDWLNSVI
jgi:hypothetical protein